MLLVYRLVHHSRYKLFKQYGKEGLSKSYSVECQRLKYSEAPKFITLRAKLSGAVYCYRSCGGRADGRRVFVCRSVTMIKGKN